MFLALAADDELFGALGYGLAEAWRKAGCSVELHAYESGGHGFGFAGRPGTTSTGWTAHFMAWLEARRPRWIYGTPDEARRRVRAFAEAGVERLMFQDFLARDLDMIDLAAEVLFDSAP